MLCSRKVYILEWQVKESGGQEFFVLLFDSSIHIFQNVQCVPQAQISLHVFSLLTSAGLDRGSGANLAIRSRGSLARLSAAVIAFVQPADLAVEQAGVG